MSNIPRELHMTIRTLLHPEDTENQTFGCHQKNPDICGYVILRMYVLFLQMTKYVNILPQNGGRFSVS